MQIGNARVSTLEQNVAPQIGQLEKAGCKRIFRDKASGAKTERPGLQEAIDFLREGDSLDISWFRRLFNGPEVREYYLLDSEFIPVAIVVARRQNAKLKESTVETRGRKHTSI